MAELRDASDDDETYGSDFLTGIGRWVSLDKHAQDAARSASEIADALAMAERIRSALVMAARWHDVGKAHEAFQRGIGADPADPKGPWAKSDGRGRPDFHIVADDGTRQSRPHFRHELASMLAWLEHHETEEGWNERDLVAYLIAAHHGRVRLGLRALPGEAEPMDSERLYARGIWQGDRLPALRIDGIELAETELRLDLMRLGEGPQGSSWTERTRRLIERHGPFALAWWEALLRIADWRASAREAGQ